MKIWSTVFLSTSIVVLAFVRLPAGIFGDLLVQVISSPIFGMTGSDPYLLQDSVKELAKSTDIIADFYREEEFRDVIKTSLHPVDFLASLGKLESSRRAFIDHASVANLFLYRRHLNLTKKYYLADIERYQKNVNTIINGSKDVYYDYGGSAILLSTFLKNINFILKNAEFLAGADIVPAKRIWAEIAYDTAQNKLTEDEKAGANFVKKITGRLGWEIVSPIFEIPTKCGGETGRGFFYIVDREGYMVPLSIDPVFQKFAATNDVNADFYRPLRDAGYEYHWQPDFNYYFCSDLSYQAEAFTLLRIRDLLEEWDTQYGGLDGFLAVRNEFLSKEIVWRSAQLALFYETDNILKKPSEAELAAKIGKNNLSILREIKLLGQEKSGYFDKLISFGAMLNRHYPKVAVRLGRAADMEGLFVARAYPSLYFLPFNSSIWMPDVRLDFTDKPAEAGRYFSRFSALRKDYSEDELLKIVLLSVEPALVDKNYK